MPFWAIVYCFLIILSGIGVVIMHKNRPIYFIPGQVLSSLCGVLMFLFYYESFIHKPLSFLVIVNGSSKKTNSSSEAFFFSATKVGKRWRFSHNSQYKM